MKKLKEIIIKWSKDRFKVTLTIIIIAFVLIGNRLFVLQILKGEEYYKSTTASVIRPIVLKASRGLIYDRYGRPLAENKTVFNLKFDNSLLIDSKTYNDEVNRVFLKIIKLLKKNNEQVHDTLPISKEKPYRFLFSDDKKEQNWKKDYLKDKHMGLNAEECVNHLAHELFKIDEGLEDQEIRSLLALRMAVYAQRYKKYNAVTLAVDVSPQTLAYIEENSEQFKAVYTEVDTIRVYPEAEYFSHILGYTRKIDDEDYELFRSHGYTHDDIVGKVGIEKAFELDLRGKDGSVSVEVNPSGRIINRKPSTQILPQAGKKVFLTLDRDLQKESYDIIEEQIKEIQLKRLRSPDKNYMPVSATDLLIAMVQTNNIRTESILDAPVGSKQNQLKEILVPHHDINFFVSSYVKNLIQQEVKANAIEEKLIQEVLREQGKSDADLSSIDIDALRKSQSINQLNLKKIIQEKFTNIEKDDKLLAVWIAKEELLEKIKKKQISFHDMFQIMVEQGLFELHEEEKKVSNQASSHAYAIFLQKLDRLEIKPYQTGIEPYGASLALADVNTGELLAAVSYPSYDNNELSNHFNYEYYIKMIENKTDPMINRVFFEQKAPGSTFKMITAIAALEKGLITPQTKIFDKTIFTEAGRPHAKCHIHGKGSHGSVNVSQALEVSCNYFFYQVSYNMGNAAKKNTLQGIGTLNEYMQYFGLDDYSGVEIEEAKPRIASPEYKRELNAGKIESEQRWYDGDTIRVAIGQQSSKFSSVNMVKYIATLANGGSRYRMHLVQKIENNDGSIHIVKKPELELKVEMKEENLYAVKQGMLDVATGMRGTIRGVFSDFPIKVGGKTGTAQEKTNKKAHTVFTAFAPFDNPQYAIAVMIPYGAFPGAPSGNITKKVLGSLMLKEEIHDRDYLDSYFLMEENK